MRGFFCGIQEYLHLPGGPWRVSYFLMKTILLVEDEDMLRGLIRELLEIKGYAVLEASQGIEALELFKKSMEPVDLVLTDVVMPHMSGSELIERLRNEQPALRVIFMSGYTGANNAAIHKSLEMPGVAFLQKPFRLNALISQVEELLIRSV
jgi:two-component system cell cycle sensor histidine kinase/response regulator CckA